MEQEPIYQFIKGVGWVPNAERQWDTEYQTRSMGKYKVTLIDRKPVLGEHFYTLSLAHDNPDGSLNFETAWGAIRHDMEYRPTDMGGRMETQGDIEHFYSLKNIHLMTIITEPCA